MTCKCAELNGKGLCNPCVEMLRQQLQRQKDINLEIVAGAQPGDEARWRVAKAIWDNETVEATLKKALPPGSSYAEWPELEESLRQPYCQSTYRAADAVLDALSRPAAGELRTCEHKEINHEGFCKSCGARAAIEIKGLSEHLARQRREAVDLRSHGDSENQATKERVAESSLRARLEREVKGLQCVLSGAGRPEGFELCRSAVLKLLREAALLAPELEGRADGDTNTASR